MYIDIHRHSSDKGLADQVLRNLFHDQTEDLKVKGMYSLGLHPWHVHEYNWQKNLDMVSSSAGHTSVLAIGEAGLDKAMEETDLDLQRRVFEQQIEIAEAVGKPMIIHCVRAYDEIQAYRKASNRNYPWIIHWYNASPQMGNDLVRKGCYLSFGLTLFQSKSKAYKTFVDLPLEHIFLETDDAEVTIKQVYQKAAEIKGISEESMIDQMRSNFYTCFKKKI